MYISIPLLAYPILQGGASTGSLCGVLGHFWDTFLRLIFRRPSEASFSRILVIWGPEMSPKWSKIYQKWWQKSKNRENFAEK